MIVRDCQQALAEALDSARPFVDEMVVVDTGSTDDTADVARRRGARVIDFEWCDDFSAARNCSLQHATGNWIFWMDADDVLPPESGRTLRKLIADHPERDAAFWVHVEQQTTDGHGRRRTTRHGHVKLFPRHPKVRFRYRVHEQVAPSIRALGLPLKMTKAVVQHVHKRSPVETRRRIQRNLRLLELDLADHPNDPFIHLNLAMTLLHVPDGLERSLQCTEQCLARCQEGFTLRLNAYLIRATAFRRLGQPENELNTLAQARHEFPDDASLLLRIAGLHAKSGDTEAAVDCYQRILNGAVLRASVLSFADVPTRAALELGRLYIQLGDQDQARKLWRRWLEKHANSQAIQQALQRLTARD